MYPANLPWVATDSGAQVSLGPLGFLIVRKVKTDFAVVVLGTPLMARSVTLGDGKERAEYAARKWVSDAGKMLWTEVEPVAPVPTQTSARPGGTGKRKA